MGDELAAVAAVSSATYLLLGFGLSHIDLKASIAQTFYSA